MKQLLLLYAVLLLVPFSNAQDSKYGSDSAKCVINSSLYREFVKQKNYADAVTGWRVAYNICPKSTKQLYKDGEKIYKFFIKKAKKAKDKEAVDKYLDTLMQIYDQRIEIYKDKDVVSGRQGYTLYKYRKSAYEDAYNKMLFSVNAKKVSAAYIQSFMYATSKMYKNKKIDAGTVVENFSKSTEILDKSIETQKDTTKRAKLIKVKENISGIFAKSGAASCDVLTSYYTPKFEAAPADLELLKTITKFLEMNKCTDSKLFLDASEALYKIEPSGRAAYNIAILSVKANNLTKAIEYYKKAIDLVDERETKAKYYLDLAKIHGKQGQYAAARSSAINAIKNKANWGEPYIFIGKIYASSASTCGQKKIEKSAVYWAVVDKFIKAKSVDPSVAAQANKLIGQYSAYFPTKEDAFFEGITDGATYTVGCWINETTKARFHK